MKQETLAKRLGTTAHLSPLLMKAARLGLHTPEDLERLAVRRGLRYYGNPADANKLREDCHLADMEEPRVSEESLSTEELAIALLSLSLPFSQHRLRMGAAMLAAENLSPQRLARLAALERCDSVVFHIATCGQRVEPQNPFWQQLLSGLPKTQIYKPDLLPHLSRFVAMTGITRRGKETVMQWIRPHSKSA